MAPDPSIPIGDSFVGLGSKGWDGGEYFYLHLFYAHLTQKYYLCSIQNNN